jgi:hypothetical protein
MLKVRAQNPCFAPQAAQRVLKTPPGVFALLREHEGEAVACVHNVSREAIDVELDISGTALAQAHGLHDLIGGKSVAGGNLLRLRLEAYQSAWLASENRQG